MTMTSIHSRLPFRWRKCWAFSSAAKGRLIVVIHLVIWVTVWLGVKGTTLKTHRQMEYK